MRSTRIFELDEYPINERNGTYGGKAGSKEAITINKEYWIVKYPQSTKNMRGMLNPYTTSPLSEYIGSNIYDILGFDVHRTILGIRNNKLVVACKDFCKNEGSLREIRTLKNVYNKELSDKLEQSMSSTSSSRLVDIDDLLTHLEYNPILNQINGIKNHFWNQFVVDILINNNDRNNGNWGLIYENGKYSIAPVYDNGSSFSNKLPDDKLSVMLQNDDRLTQSVFSSQTTYQKNGNLIFAKDILSLESLDLDEAITRIVPIIADKSGEIESFINNIPESYKEYTVCSKARKEFYIKTINIRIENLLKPRLEAASERIDNIFINSQGKSR